MEPPIDAMEQLGSPRDAMEREELGWLVERLRELESAVCEWAAARDEPGQRCETHGAEHSFTECVCASLGEARRTTEARLGALARE